MQDLLVEAGLAFPESGTGDLRIFITGSGAGPLAEPLGAKFVQEVNAVTMAVERLHPDVGSVIELGGQDAKIIIFRRDERTGERQSQTSMNDKCASGTGATIDKCLIKAGMAPEAVKDLVFDAERLHHVAGKCGVFAETDIVNLVKSGIPAAEIMNSLADAIVAQNLSVLTRGNTLRHRVLLLGGPNTYLPFLRECWRLRIREAWDERGYAYPKDAPIQELIFVPENAEYYAAYGAVIYGMHEPAHVGRYRGLEPLREFVLTGRKATLGAAAGPGLACSSQELESFRERYRIPRFEPPALEPGTRVRAAIGLDGGSTSSKCVLVAEDGRLLAKEYQLSKGNPILDMKEMLTRLRAQVAGHGATLEVIGFGVTGYAGDVIDRALYADANIVETVAHMMSAVHYFGKDIDVVCDIGGQDIKVLFLQKGDVKNFRLSNQCSAGNGMLLQAMADQFGLPVTEYADAAFEASLAPRFSYGCAVFLDTDRVNFQKMGFSKEELLAGLALVLPKNVWQYVVQVPRMAELGRKFVLQGGTQHNLAALKAQVDYIHARVPDAEVFVHPHAGEAGAIGAAFEALRVVRRRGTRIVVRRPSDDSRFSGIVLAESMHPRGNAWMFHFTHTYTMTSGHIGLEILTSDPARLVEFNEGRYRDLRIARGQAGEIIAQVGALIRSARPDHPLSGLPVRKLILAGTSASAGVLINYLPAHMVYRLGDMTPIYDGFLPTSNGANIGRTDVPMIQVPTTTEAMRGRVPTRQDGDMPGDQFRVYEFPGMPHVDTRHVDAFRPNPCRYPISLFPLGAYMSVALHHLVEWADKGTVPPRADRILVDRNTANDGSLIALDEFGNPRGGVRSPYVDVPSARYGFPSEGAVPPTPNTVPWIALRGEAGIDRLCGLTGYQIQLPDARLKQLYGDKATYLAKVRQRVDELTSEGWSLPLYREQILADAAGVDF